MESTATNSPESATNAQASNEATAASPQRMSTSIAVAQVVLETFLPPEVDGYGLFLVTGGKIEFISNGSIRSQVRVLRKIADQREATMKAQEEEAKESASTDATEVARVTKVSP